MDFGFTQTEWLCCVEPSCSGSGLIFLLTRCVCFCVCITVSVFGCSGESFISSCLLLVRFNSSNCFHSDLASPPSIITRHCSNNQETTATSCGRRQLHITHCTRASHGKHKSHGAILMACWLIKSSQ